MAYELQQVPMVFRVFWRKQEAMLFVWYICKQAQPEAACIANVMQGEETAIISGGNGLKKSQLLVTVQCLYKAVNFLPNLHKRHPIARPWGRGMGWVSFVSSTPD